MPLTHADIAKLHLENHPRIASEAIARAIEEMPGVSQWHPASGEFLIATPWRHRDDIPLIRDLSAFVNENELVQAAVNAARELGMIGFVASETYEKRRASFYERNGMQLLESVIAFVHHRIQDYLDATLKTRLEFYPVTVHDTDLMNGVIGVDEAAFEPVWQNSIAEFEWWMNQPSVEVWAGVLDGKVVSYYGATYFQKFGHLDRIAVHPDHQGTGLGSESLMAALRRMATLGLPNAALCTQADNQFSQQLYSRAGFSRFPRDDYDIYGIVFQPDQTEVSAE